MKKITYDDYLLIMGLHDTRSILYEVTCSDRRNIADSYSRLTTYKAAKRYRELPTTKLIRQRQQIIAGGRHRVFTGLITRLKHGAVP